MRTMYGFLCTLLIATATCPVQAQKSDPREIYPTAILAFQERGDGLKGQGESVADILFAMLTAEKPELVLVERKELNKIMDELRLNASAVVSTNNALKLGQLTGAKILVTGSIFKVGNKTYIVAKVIGTETSRVLGCSVNGTETVDVLSEKLAATLGEKISKSAAELMPKPETRETRLARLKTAIGSRQIPPCVVRITENHLNQVMDDPAAQTEMISYIQHIGGTVIDSDKATDAEYMITGQGISEFAGEIAQLKSVKARLEVKVTDKNGNLIAVDRQTAVSVDLTEVLAGKKALQDAAAEIALRILPKLAK